MFFSNPERDYIYGAITHHVANPTLVKTKTQDEFSVYMTQVQSLLLNEKRYIVVLVLQDSRPIGTMDSLVNLKWTSFQMRTLEDISNLPLKPHQYNVQRGFSSEISLVCQSRTPSITIYRSPNQPNLEVSLLHTRKTEFEYPNEGNLASALETFQTIVRFL